MVTYQIPTQARFLTVSTTFSAPFNIPPPLGIVGGYSFTLTAGCRDVVMMDLQPNTAYLINNLSIGANITEEQYLQAIIDFPKLYVRRRLNGVIVYQQPIPISRFHDGIEAAAWIYSDQGNDQLTLTLEGSLNQLASMIGIDPVILQITFSVFAVDSGYFNSSFRDQQARSIGQANRR